MKHARFFLAGLMLLALAFGGQATTFYVDPDSSGGTGTTNALTGTNAAFASLAACVASRVAANADLTNDGAGVIEEWIVDSNGPSHTVDSTFAVVTGFTTDEDNYVYIHTPLNHRALGVWDATKYRMVINELGWNTAALLVEEDYTRVDGLQIQASCENRAAAAIILDMGNGQCSNNILKAGTAEFKGTGLSMPGYTNNVNSWNNIIYGFATGIFIDSNSGTSNLYNNAVYGCGTYGIDCTSPGTRNIVNTIVNSCTDNYHGTYTTSYSCSDTASELSGTGDRSGTSGDVTFVSVGSGTEDFHLGAADTNAKEHGTTGLTSTDVDGDSVSGTRDIGADEYVGGEPPATPATNSRRDRGSRR